MNQMEVLDYETNEFTVVIENKGSKGWLKRKLYLKAIKENNTPEVQRLLRLGVPVDFLGLNQGRTPHSCSGSTIVTQTEVHMGNSTFRH